jgi:Zn finger protein HypA/HybF involved in hydrogenase expression
MEKRDLKADLEAIREGATLFGDPNPGVNTQYELYEIAEHAIERAMKAEARAQKLLDVLGRVIPSYLVGQLGQPELMDSVREATVVRGEWTTNSDYPDTVICSLCGWRESVWWADKGTNYCPNCGAKMEVK